MMPPSQYSSHAAHAAHAAQVLLPEALTCPWCKTPATPAPGPQACSACRKRFTLSAGPALDGSLIPPFHPNASKVTVRWSAVVTYQFATLEAAGIMSGTLDPVVALAPVSQSGIAYPDVVSIAVWRGLGWLDIVAAVLLPLPFSLLFAVGAVGAASHGATGAVIMGVIAAALGVVTWFLLRRGAIIGRRQVRIVGRWTSFTVPFKTSPAFHAELFRRCGLAPMPIP